LKLDKSKFTIYFETIDKYYKGFSIYLKLKRLIKLFSDAGYKVLDNFSRKSLYFSCSALRNDNYCIGPKLELYDCYNDFGNKNRVIGILGSSNVIKSFYTATNVLPVICRDCPVLSFCYAGGCPYKLIHGNFVYDKLFCKDFKKIIYNKLVMRLCNKYEN
jgi:radical SAM protein with 4Fe4S-binding SPASM domain